MVEGFDPQEHGLPVEVEIIRHSGGVVAIAKPPGLATQAPPGLPSVEAWLRARLSPGAYVGVPHRIDRSVSGVLLMAVTPRAARTLSRQFERRQVRKTYLALVAGPAQPTAVSETDEWRDAVVKVPNEPRARVAVAADEDAREAVTHVRVTSALADGTLLMRLEPLTGRMHQLRVQAAARGMPIIGDKLYGSSLSFGAETPDPRLRRIALHAWRIEYEDPGSGNRIRVEAALPSWWPAEARAATESSSRDHEGGIQPV